jgi:hypothetical protein
MRKYRESELKHGRLAMLGCTGFLTQEVNRRNVLFSPPPLPPPVLP